MRQYLPDTTGTFVSVHTNPLPTRRATRSIIQFPGLYLSRGVVAVAVPRWRFTHGLSAQQSLDGDILPPCGGSLRRHAASPSCVAMPRTLPRLDLY